MKNNSKQSNEINLFVNCSHRQFNGAMIMTTNLFEIEMKSQKYIKQSNINDSMSMNNSQVFYCIDKSYYIVKNILTEQWTMKHFISIDILTMHKQNVFVHVYKFIMPT